jgi:hypothetical protein
MGALHEVNASYYSTTSTGNPTQLLGGHPNDKWGWAAGAGLRLNFPMIGEGDYLQAQVNYTEGAARYVFFTPNSNWGKIDGSAEAFGVLSDCVYGGTIVGPTAGTNTGCNLTTAWGFNASFEHHWTPAWQTSVYGGWDSVSYNAQANAMLCSAGGFGNNGVGNAAVAGAGCDMNWSTYFVGSRTQWNISKTFYMGVDVMYENLNSAKLGVATTGTCATNIQTVGLCGFASCSSAQHVESSSSNWTIRFRAHKDFLP